MVDINRIEDARVKLGLVRWAILAMAEPHYDTEKEDFSSLLVGVLDVDRILTQALEEGANDKAERSSEDDRSRLS